MDRLRFDNWLLRALPGDGNRRNFPRLAPGVCWSPVETTPVAQPRLLAYSREMAEELGLSDAEVRSPLFAEVFAGNRRLAGMETWAARYGGHQFGHWAGQLGDGRAISLGEVVAASGKRWELQLKGAGPTPYSRRGDGRAVLRSSLREFLCSEAMHHLGIPTTRALSLVLTGDRVMRDMFYDGNAAYEAGAVVCRVAPSFIRFGNFEIHAALQEDAQLEQLIEFTLERDYPELDGDRLGWFREVARRTALLMVEWMRVGFVHGVMNTDNLSTLGLTIDYGPYGWIDDYDPDWTPNTTDSGRKRYRFGNQPHIAQWNLVRLAEALAGKVGTPEQLGEAIDLYVTTYNQASDEMNARKFGFPAPTEEDLELVRQAYALMHESQLDMTLFFRALAHPKPELGSCSYDLDRFNARRDAWGDWLQRYQARLAQLGERPEERQQRMNSTNPQFILRNYLAQQAIDRAEEGDLTLIEELLEASRQPYRALDPDHPLAQKRPEWARHKAGCSMLSCSS